jgi:radical SAM protein with 4Fe4S-binding SPASM domain
MDGEMNMENDNGINPVIMGKRIESKDLREQNRVALQDAIPLDSPFVVYIDPTNKCNLRCEFCPTADKALLRQVGRKGATMDFSLFEKIISDLKEFPRPLKLLSLYKDGEPLMHPRISDMIALAKSSGVAERVWTKTNGVALNPKLNRKLVAAGLDMIHISVEAVSSEGYLKVAKAKVDYDEFKANLADLHTNRGKCDIYVKIADTGLSCEEIEKFYADFQPISTHCAVEKLMGWSNSGLKDFTLGTDPDTYDGLPLVNKKICAYPFYVMAVNPDASVSLCGNDWSYKTAVGDVSKQSMREIWEGEELRRFRLMHLDGRRGENAACGDCYYLRIVPDNLDPHAERLAELLRSGKK